MFKKTIMASLLALSMSSAFAFGDNQTQGQAQGQLQGQGQVQGINSHIDNNVRTNASAFAASASASKSNSKAASNSGGNVTTQGVTVTDSGKVDYNGEYTLNNVPNVYSPNVYPTAPCMGSTSGGVAVAGFGVSLGSSWEAPECQILETARNFEQAGAKEDAMAIRCQAKYAAVAPSCVALRDKVVTQ